MPWPVRSVNDYHRNRACSPAIRYNRCARRFRSTTPPATPDDFRCHSLDDQPPPCGLSCSVALLGKAAVAMWWDMAPAHRAEFEDWHSREHFPERMSIPGFLRGSRWASSDGSDGFFVMYELDVYETLTSPHYLARLNDPDAMVDQDDASPSKHGPQPVPCRGDVRRGNCEIDRHDASLSKTRRSRYVARLADGCSGRVFHVSLESPAAICCRLTRPAAGTTQEQKIRGGADAIADWIVLVNGYDAQALAEVMSTRFSTASLTAAGTQPGPADVPVRSFLYVDPARSPSVNGSFAAIKRRRRNDAMPATSHVARNPTIVRSTGDAT